MQWSDKWLVRLDILEVETLSTLDADKDGMVIK